MTPTLRTLAAALPVIALASGVSGWLLLADEEPPVRSALAAGLTSSSPDDLAARALAARALAARAPAPRSSAEQAPRAVPALLEAAPRELRLVAESAPEAAAALAPTQEEELDPRSVEGLPPELAAALQRGELLDPSELEEAARGRAGDLRAALAADDLEASRRAEQALLNLGVDAAPVLADLVAGDDPRLAGRAALLLGMLRAPGATETLNERLASAQDDSELQSHIARGLGLTGDLRAHEALDALLESDDRSVRRAAASALAGAGPEGAARLLARLDHRPQDAAWVAEALVSAPDQDQAARALEGLLASADADGRASALLALDVLGADGALVRAEQALQDPDLEVRLAAVDLLVRHREQRDEAARLLSLASRDPEERVRARAAELLARL